MCVIELGGLLPQLTAVRVEHVVASADTLRVRALTSGGWSRRLRWRRRGRPVPGFCAPCIAR
ncbi:hypothetical protein B4N89_40840 [Embleya scabrispora]|uniref:Uncharacterized protein n=1 Tax=Embleya scabrispora TaxID=159449 RepID=A0A1T3NJH0_9ACTN|nr:hypothetical protein B4N89_40840 [Embleya scabrispora]